MMNTHFKDLLLKFQTEKSTIVPLYVHEMILDEIKKDNNVKLESITHAQIRRYLKKLRYYKYYENINEIIYHLNGTKPSIISPEIADQLYDRFQQSQSNRETIRSDSNQEETKYHPTELRSYPDQKDDQTLEKNFIDMGFSTLIPN
jgi:hypothetical protein